LRLMRCIANRPVCNRNVGGHVTLFSGAATE
jgi:hypothetical protein